MGKEKEAKSSASSASGVTVNDGLPGSEESTIIICPPLAMDRGEAYHGDHQEAKQSKGIVFKVLEMLKGMRPGDVVSFQVPPQMNLPKSQLQCYTEQIFICNENLLDKCADGAMPLDRFLAVVAWSISNVRPVPFGKVPYNPIQGETHHVTAGDFSILAEQVSHHPSASALYGTNPKKKIEILQWNYSQPRFWGNSVTISVEGERILRLLEHGETYETTAPKLTFRFWPGTLCEWTGDTVVKCAKTGLEAHVHFKSRPYFSKKGNQVSGKVIKSSSKEVLYTLSGFWDEQVMVEQGKKGGQSSLLYDGKAALSNLKTSEVTTPQALSPMDSVVVWSKVTKGVWSHDWELARLAKQSVEEAQRALSKQSSKAGETWKPKYFNRTAQGGWEWALKGQPVPPAPITW